MKNKTLLLVFLIIIIVALFIFQGNNLNRYTCKSKEQLPIERMHKYAIKIVDKKGKPISNKRIHIKQIRQDFLIYNRQDFSNYVWIETMNPILREFESKHTITSMQIINDLHLNDEKDPKWYYMLVIPISFSDKVKISEYEKREMNALIQYAKACEATNFVPDYIQILSEFNQKMQLKMHFDIKESIDFADRYIRKTKELFPNSKIILSLGPMYCFSGFHYPPGENNTCIHELQTKKFIDHINFLKLIEKKGSPYDIIGMEYQIASHHSPDFNHFKIFFDSLSMFQKPIFIREYRVLSDEIKPEIGDLYPMFIANRPKNGWTESYQAEMFKKTIEYINSNPFIIGIAQFGRKDTDKSLGNDVILPNGLLSKDGKPKKSYYLIKDRYTSWFTSCDLKTDAEGMIHFFGLPGRYKISLGIFKKKIIDLKDENIIQITK